MSIQRFLKDYSYNDSSVNVDVLSNDEISKDIRIVFKNRQIMKEHQAPFPISVMVLKGAIQFTYGDKSVRLDPGDEIKLGASVVHELLAKDDSVVKLTLSKKDRISRVEGVLKL